MKICKCGVLSGLNKNPFVHNQKHVVSSDMKKNTMLLLEKMNQCTKYKENKDGTGFTCNVLTNISLAPNVKFIDERFLIAQTDNPEKNMGRCTLEMGNTMLQIDIKTGEILGYKKSFLKTWRSIYLQAEKHIQTFLACFDNSDIVKMNYFGISGFTKKGFKRLRQC